MRYFSSLSTIHERAPQKALKPKIIVSLFCQSGEHWSLELLKERGPDPKARRCLLDIVRVLQKTSSMGEY